MGINNRKERNGKADTKIDHTRSVNNEKQKNGKPETNIGYRIGMTNKNSTFD